MTQKKTDRDELHETHGTTEGEHIRPELLPVEADDDPTEDIEDGDDLEDDDDRTGAL